MIERVSNYQFHFFAPNTHLEPKAEIIVPLMEAFKDKGFIPTTASELQFSPVQATRPQVQLMSPNGEWNVAFEATRVLLKKVPVIGWDIGSAEAFAKKAEEIFRCLLGVQQLVGNRLSYVTKGLLPEMPDGKLVEVNKRVLNLLPFYEQCLPYEWTTRNVAKYDVMLGDKAEILNVITDINRAQGMIMLDTGGLPFDRIEIGFDINTYQGNPALRFGADDVELFLNVAIRKSQEIMTEIEGKLDG